VRTGSNLDKENDNSSAVLNSMDTSKFAAGSLPAAPELNTLPTMMATKLPRHEEEQHMEMRLSLIGLYSHSLRTSRQAMSMVESESILFLRKCSEVTDPRLKLEAQVAAANTTIQRLMTKKLTHKLSKGKTTDISKVKSILSRKELLSTTTPQLQASSSSYALKLACFDNEAKFITFTARFST
jgi:hypothetical protein